MLVFDMGGASVCALSNLRALQLQAYYLPSVVSLVVPSLSWDHYSSALLSVSVSLQTFGSKKPSAIIFSSTYKH